MENILEVIGKINEQTDALYEGLCDNVTQEVNDAIKNIREILNQIENEN